MQKKLLLFVLCIAINCGICQAQHKVSKIKNDTTTINIDSFVTINNTEIGDTQLFSYKLDSIIGDKARRKFYLSMSTLFSKVVKSPVAYAYLNTPITKFILLKDLKDYAIVYSILIEMENSSLKDKKPVKFTINSNEINSETFFMELYENPDYVQYINKKLYHNPNDPNKTFMQMRFPTCDLNLSFIEERLSKITLDFRTNSPFQFSN